MNHYRFIPNVAPIAYFDGYALKSEFKDEVSMYGADLDFARSHAGPLARRFLDAIPSDYFELAASSGLTPNCDIRLHQLHTGQYPASPGWHCDAATRETMFAPDAPGFSVAHNVIGTISSHPLGVSNTEFLLDPHETFSPHVYGNDLALWDQVTSEVSPFATTLRAADGHLYTFDPYTLHRATPAKWPGWRLFFRMSLWEVPSNHVPGVSRFEQAYEVVRLSSSSSVAAKHDTPSHLRRSV